MVARLVLMANEDAKRVASTARYVWIGKLGALNRFTRRGQGWPRCRGQAKKRLARTQIVGRSRSDGACEMETRVCAD